MPIDSTLKKRNEKNDSPTTAVERRIGIIAAVKLHGRDAMI